jgi:uncharacterized membrane protein
MMEENQVPTAAETVEISDDDKLWALLGWITGVVALIALFMEDKKQRPFIKYNAVMALAVVIAIAILVSIMSVVIPCVGGLITALAFIYPIYLGIQAYQGKWVEVPWLTDFVKKQGWASAP